MTQANPPWLDDTEAEAWRAFLAVVNRVFPEIERTLREHDLLGVHYTVLVALSEAPERTLRLSELAEAANCSLSRLSHRIRTLVERGDVEIAADPDDGRAKNATLTRTGLERLEVAAPEHVADVRRLVFDRLSSAQTAALADALTTIADGLYDDPRLLNPRG
ncbi:MAG: MarR family transcriptional regulator [Actinomycetota bacterium]